VDEFVWFQQESNIVFVKTHKTGGTTLAALLVRYAQRHNIKVRTERLITCAAGWMEVASPPVKYPRRFRRFRRRILIETTLAAAAKGGRKEGAVVLERK